MKCYNYNGFGHKAQECWYSRHAMKHAFYNSERTIIKPRRDDNIKTPWKNSKEQGYSQKGTNMNTQNGGITRRYVAKMWRRKPEWIQQEDYEQTESADTEQRKYFSMTKHLQEEDIANKELLSKGFRKNKSLCEMLEM